MLADDARPRPQVREEETRERRGLLVGCATGPPFFVNGLLILGPGCQEKAHMKWAMNP
jgi:hypothetical protein